MRSRLGILEHCAEHSASYFSSHFAETSAGHIFRANGAYRWYFESSPCLGIESKEGIRQSLAQEGSAAAHLSWRGRRRRCRAGGGGRPVAVGRGTILKRVRFERNRRSEILVKGNPGSDPRSIQEGSSGTGAATADLQGAVNFVCCVFSLVLPIALPALNMRDGLKMSCWFRRRPAQAPRELTRRKDRPPSE